MRGRTTPAKQARRLKRNLRGGSFWCAHELDSRETRHNSRRLGVTSPLLSNRSSGAVPLARWVRLRQPLRWLDEVLHGTAGAQWWALAKRQGTSDARAASAKAPPGIPNRDARGGLAQTQRALLGVTSGCVDARSRRSWRTAKAAPSAVGRSSANWNDATSRSPPQRRNRGTT